jgi:hypothetical protein
MHIQLLRFYLSVFYIGEEFDFYIAKDSSMNLMKNWLKSKLPGLIIAVQK